MKHNHLTNLPFIYKWIEQEGYKSAHYITNENVLAVADLIETVSELQLLVPFGGNLLNIAFTSVNQLNHLAYEVEGVELVEDLVSVANIIRELVEFDTINLYYYGSTPEFKFDALRNAIELALNLNVLNTEREETMALVFNIALASFGANYSANDFEGINWEVENATI